MKKRLHDPAIWNKSWFRKLSKDAKLLWLYLCDICDCSGVYDRDDKQACFFLELKTLPYTELAKNLFFFDHTQKVLIIDFCEFQYRLPEKYNEDSNLHKNIINRLIYHKLSFKILEKLKKKPTVGATVGATVNISISKSISKRKEGGAGEEKQFIPPSEKEVIDYFKEKGFTENAAKQCFQGYAINNWIDSQGKKIKNWKQKAIQVWFTEKNRDNKKIERKLVT